MGQVRRDKAEFARHVRTALARLYDPIALQAHPLARAMAGWPPHPGRGSQLGEVLRQRLLEAIEALKPDPRVERGSRAWSPYRLLHLRYVEAHDPVAVQQQLAMSKSQYYRDHEQALERLASLLWEWELELEKTSPGTQAALSIPRQDEPEPAHHNLPLQLTSFVGRTSELAQVAHLLRAGRLLTLTGAGGSGKTRLALQAAEALLGGYQQGVWIVELAPLAESGMVPKTAAFAMGVREEPGEPIEATLVRTLARQQRLLVLDNCEHLIAACARLAEALLKACPNLAILVTSREPLHITGESVFHVPPLSTPDPRRLPEVHRLRQYEAIQLFVDRATAVRPGFELTPGNAEAVAHICHRLDGIPLAIELAAARVQALSVQQINDRLQDRFRLLTTGSRTALPRHQTLRAMVDWSFDLLPEPQKALLRRLSVFAGGWTLEAAEAVCSGDPVARQDVLDLLGELVAKSLVMAEESSAGAVRHRMLETFRQYGLQRLEEAGELTGTYDAHARYFVELAKAGDAELVGPTQLACLRRLDLEHDNFRAVLSRSRAGLIAERSGAPLGPSLAKNLYLFWFKSSYLGEAADWLTCMATVAESHDAPALAVNCRTKGGFLHFLLGKRELGWDLLDRAREQSLEVQHTECSCWIHDLRMVMFLFGGDLASAESEGRLAIPLCDAAQVNFLRPNDRLTLGLVLLYAGRDQEASRLLEEGFELAKALGERFQMAHGLGYLGQLSMYRGDYALARQRFEQSLRLFEEIENVHVMLITANVFGRLLLRMGEVEEARNRFRRNLALARESGRRQAIANALAGLAMVDVRMQQFERAAELFATAQALRASAGLVPTPFEQAEEERHIAPLRSRLADAAFESIWTRGTAMDMDEAIQRALEVETAARA